VLPVWLARVPIRVGYLRRRAFFLTDGLRSEWEGERRKPVPMPSYYLALAALVGAEVLDESLELAITPDEESAAAQLRTRLGLRAGERYAALNPGASFGTSKLWRADRFAALAGEIHRRHGWRSLVLCGPAKKSSRTRSRARRPGGDRHLDDAGLPRAVEARAAGCRAAGDDRHGPAPHRDRVPRPTVVIMGPTDPRYTASNLEQTVVVREDVFCGPCHKKICDLDHRCMELIDVPRVVRAVDYVLGLTDTLAPPRRAPPGALPFPKPDPERKAAPMQPKLIMHSDGKRTEYVLKDGATLIGRSNSASVPLDDRLASRAHCRIERQGDVFVLRDEGSQNGTFLNGSQVLSSVLSPGDQIRIGTTTIYFQREPDAKSMTETVIAVAPLKTDELVQQLTKERSNLLRLQRINRMISGERDLPTLLRLIVDSAIELTGAERGFLLSYQGQNATFEVARNFEEDEVKEPELAVSRSLAEEVRSTGKA
jgi:pSer/pThr/pTyr-binding forkhead associated (FHA) protein